MEIKFYDVSLNVTYTNWIKRNLSILFVNKYIGELFILLPIS